VALQFMAAEGPVARATVCAEGFVPAGDEILVKDWSENEGMLEALVGLGLVEDTGRRVSCGFAEAAVCRMTEKLIASAMDKGGLS